MPAQETKQVTVTLTATVTGAGSPTDFIGAVTDQIRDKLSPGSWYAGRGAAIRNVRDMRITEAHMETV